MCGYTVTLRYGLCVLRDTIRCIRFYEGFPEAFSITAIWSTFLAFAREKSNMLAATGET